MTEAIPLTLAHWLYLAGALAVFVTMVFRTTVVVPAIAATFLVALAHTGSLTTAFTSVFNASIVAAGELFNIFLIIALMTALLGSLRHLGSDLKMIMPFQKVMVNGKVAYLVLAAVTYLISLFFWPTPAVPLVGAILIPAAIAAGLPAIGAVAAIAIAGQGMALSSDYIIQVAPGISAGAAGLDVSQVADRAFALSLITGGVALLIAFFGFRKSIMLPDQDRVQIWEKGGPLECPEALKKEKAENKSRQMGSFGNKSQLAQVGARSDREKTQLARAVVRVEQGASATVDATALPAVERWAGFFAVLVPIAFLAIITYMVVAKYFDVLPALQGGDGAALVGGVAALMLLFASFAGTGRKCLTVAADHITDGLVFAFKAMGAVLPIAGFFFMGNSETASTILGVASAPGFLFDLVQSVQHLIPQNSLFMGIGILLIGMVTGADGSGFSGLPLTGALAGALGATVSIETSTLAAIGQMGAIWTGGGTLVAWSSLIAVAGFARVPVLEAVRALFVPVVSGLVIATVVGVTIW
ncbi:hypothetical protein [Marinobacter sp. X15-166B]|uniref:hypothetical protein n=1 Tax=Marinobacter sp. X15-166B TaxID=1897620 RepID=UPI00085C6727|nr:hypothetical protein [Marinobacter sp. X15-166B]OEY66028.1 hypothetical protein BG841_05855 [Marinobacter sp. X15-166B]